MQERRPPRIAVAVVGLLSDGEPDHDFSLRLADRLSAFAGEPASIAVLPETFAAAEDDRVAAFLSAAAADHNDAVWCAPCECNVPSAALAILAGLPESARSKTFLAGPRAGFLLAGLYKHGRRVIQVPRTDSEDAGLAALMQPASNAAPMAAFDISILSQILGTPLEPDLAGHVVVLGEDADYLYRIDRAMAHIAMNPSMQRIAGFKLGAVANIKPNDPPFGQTEEEIVVYWCARSGIPYLGRAAESAVRFGL